MERDSIRQPLTPHKRMKSFGIHEQRAARLRATRERDRDARGDPARALPSAHVSARESAGAVSRPPRPSRAITRRIFRSASQFLEGLGGPLQEAVDAAGAAFPGWSRSPTQRANVLLRAAGILRRRRHEIERDEEPEVGTNGSRRTLNTAEAIDFLEFSTRARWPVLERASRRADAGEVKLVRIPGARRRRRDSAVEPLPCGPSALGMTAATIVTGTPPS
jgi:delta 1-pyrroline-5-carboxylate dehydrogenase